MINTLQQMRQQGNPYYELVGQSEQDIGTPVQMGYTVDTPLGGTRYQTSVYDLTGGLMRSNVHDAGSDKYGLRDLAKLAAFAGGANALGGTLGSFGSFGGTGAATAPASAGGAVGGFGSAASAGAGATGAASAAGKMLGGKMFEFLIPAAASLLGSSMSARSAKEAANTSAEAADKATALQRQMYEESVARQQPFLAGGTEDYNRLRSLMSGGPGAAQQFLQMDPGYGFRLSEGLKAMERGAAARGGLMSGAALKAGQRYGQDLASQEYGAAYNRLANLADIGPRAAGVMGTLGQNYAGNVGNIMMGQGQTAANAALARGSAYSGGLNQLGYLAGRYYGQPQGGGYMAPVESRDLSGVGSGGGGGYYPGDYYGPG